jgi:hypothetical protein
MLSKHREKQRLWVITECHYPEVTSSGHYLTKIAEGLTDTFDVKVICGQPSFLSRGTDSLIHGSPNGVEIFRVRGTNFDTGFAVKRTVNTITRGVSMFWGSLRSFRKGDRVLVVTSPVHLPFTTAIASLVKGGSYTLLIKELYPDRLVSLGKLKQNSIVVKAIHFANAWLFKHAARIIVVDPEIAKLISAYTGGLGVPIKIIPDWADSNELLGISEPARKPAEFRYTLDVALERYRNALR